MPGVHKVDLIGQEVVAEELGVTSQAISNWYARELEGLPVPTLIQYKKGKTPLKVWRRAQLSVWVKWHASHLAEQGQHIPRKQRSGTVV
jgi:hypothetical protein